jgi:fibronectin-binding autotransporter adhesin
VGGGGVSKNGNGTVILPSANPYTGTNTINFGVLRIADANALGTGAIAVGVDGGARLELTSGITVTNPLTLTYRLEGNPPVVVPSVANVSGTNTITGLIRTVESPLADGMYFAATGGKLIVTCGYINSGGGTAARTIRLAGAGEGDWRGVITNGVTSPTAVRKVDNGTWILSGTNAYTGGTSVAAGSLLVNGQLAAASMVVVSNTGTMGGHGVIAAPVNINAGGRLAPTGVLTINNTLTLDSTSTTLMALAKSVPSASVRGLATVNYDGTLTVTISDWLWGGEVFKLFEAATYNGTFAALDLPPIDPALSWDASRLALDGTLRVTGNISRPQIINRASAMGGSSLVISGTNGVPGSTYYILTSTNLTLPLSSWTPLLTNVFDGSGNYALTNTIDPAAPASFYILQQP